MSILTHCDAEIELSPSITGVGQPSIFLDGALDKIVDVMPTYTPAYQKKIALNEPLTHGPTVARLYRKAIMFEGSIYANKHLYVICKQEKRRRIAWDRLDDIADVQLCADDNSHAYFGHWVRDALIREILAYERGLTPINFSGSPWPHARGYRELADLPVVETNGARVSNLWIVDDGGLNVDWCRRHRLLRDRIRSRAKSAGHRYLYIARGEAGKPRELINADAVQNVLEKNGFHTIYPEKMAPCDIADQLSGANIIIGMEGSALNHAQLAAPEGAAILVIQPAVRFNCFHKLYADAGNLRFGFIMAEMTGDGMKLSIDDLLLTIDLVQP